MFGSFACSKNNAYQNLKPSRMAAKPVLISCPCQSICKDLESCLAERVKGGDGLTHTCQVNAHSLSWDPWVFLDVHVYGGRVSSSPSVT